MDSRDLPAGMLPLIKAATREMILAAGGVKAVKALTGLSDGVLSRCGNDAYPDILPFWAVAMIEFASQRPIAARALAGLTAHQVVPIERDGDGADGDHVGDLVGIASSGAAVTGALGAALGDGRVTPGEAKVVIAAVGRHQQSLDRTVRRLAVVANRAAAGGS